MKNIININPYQSATAIKQKTDLLTFIFDKYLGQMYGGVLFGSMLNSDRQPKDTDIFIFYRENLDFIPFEFYESVSKACQELRQHGITPDVSIKHAADLQIPNSAIRCFRMGNALLHGRPFGWTLDMNTLPRKDVLLYRDVQYQTTSHELLDYNYRLLLHEPDSRIILRNSILIIGFCACWILNFDYNLGESEAYNDLYNWLGGDDSKLISLIRVVWRELPLVGSKLEVFEQRVEFVQLASLVLCCTYDQTKKESVIKKIYAIYTRIYLPCEVNML